MTIESEIARIKGLAEKATKGPWEHLRTGTIVCHRDRAAVQPHGSLIDWICSMQWSNCPNADRDAAFIADARTSIPRLCDALAEALKYLRGPDRTRIEAILEGKTDV